MKLKFLLRRIATPSHGTRDSYNSWKTAVTRYPELRDKKQPPHSNLTKEEISLIDNVVLFYDKKLNNLLNLEWGWREYILKKL